MCEPSEIVSHEIIIITFVKFCSHLISKNISGIITLPTHAGETIEFSETRSAMQAGLTLTMVDGRLAVLSSETIATITGEPIDVVDTSPAVQARFGGTEVGLYLAELAYKYGIKET